MMIVKKLLGIAPGNRKAGNTGNTGNWTFGWTPSQASALSGNAKSNNVQRETARGNRQVGVYGVLAIRSR
ncbi:hypothetical protein [Collimonas sp. OK242]|uniref:hypothetical protein n=1 Tax=Collimonas sp. OK242 TaxID=1798195 RepID=UPI00115F7D01|nr:hypothetical protein [Collimonas sp. OK242]